VLYPSGIRGILQRYRKPIEKVIGGWVDWEEPLGCGHFGCAWEIWSQDPAYDMVPNLARPTGRVLKISTDATEGPVAAAIMKTGLDRSIDGLARLYGVWRIPEPVQRRASRETGYVIVREAVRPFDVNFDSAFPAWVPVLQAYNNAAHRMLRLKTPYKVQEQRAKAQAALRELFRYPETYFVARAIDALSLEGILLADVHHGNLGFRTFPTEAQPVDPVAWNDGVSRPPLVIFDPGHSAAPAVEIPDLW